MSTSAAPPALPARPLRRSVATTVVGNFVEYFDWLAYGLFAPIFAQQFFPSSNPVTSLLGVFAVFGAGMLCRPLGGLLLGRLADRHGRKPALVLSIALMAAGSLAMGITPTYETIGLFAALILLIARAAQGISAGGEWPSAVTYLMEQAPAKRKCFYGSLFSMSASAGAFAASFLGGALTSRLGAEVMREWGWRVPFIVGGVMGIILLVARNRITETAVFQREVRPKPARGSLGRLMTQYWRQLLLVIPFVAGLTVVVGTWTAVVPAMGHRVAPPGMMLWVAAVISGTGILIMPFLGLLADRVGALPFLTVVTIAFAIAAPFAYLGIVGEFGFLAFAYGTGWLFMGCVMAVMPTVVAAMFSPEVRTLGIGLPYGLTTAVLGGFTPSVATYLGRNGANDWFIGGVVAIVLLGWLAALVAGRKFTLAPRVAPAPTVEVGLATTADVR